MAITTRPARLADADELAALHVATWQETYGHLLPVDFFDEAHRRSRLTMWHSVLSQPQLTMTVRVVGSGDGVLAGFAWTGPPVGDAPPRDRQLYAIYVRRAHHGTGIGQALLDAVLDDDPAFLWVAKQNPRAIAFYRRNGFELDGVEQVDAAHPAITDARMVRG